jgi:hypothetical protein
VGEVDTASLKEAVVVGPEKNKDQVADHVGVAVLEVNIQA